MTFSGIVRMCGGEGRLSSFLVLCALVRRESSSCSGILVPRGNIRGEVFVGRGVIGGWRGDH
ncbi:MAG: hypothetical protein ACPHF0_00690, partial [Poseidonia sp.]